MKSQSYQNYIVDSMMNSIKNVDRAVFINFFSIRDWSWFNEYCGVIKI